LSGAITGTLLAIIYKKKEIRTHTVLLKEKIELKIANQYQTELNLLQTKYKTNQSLPISYTWKTKEENSN
jgi:hypothetical protein